MRQRNRRIHSRVVDSSVPLTHYDPKDLGLILFSKETQNPFSDSFGLDFLIEMHSKGAFPLDSFFFFI